MISICVAVALSVSGCAAKETITCTGTKTDQENNTTSKVTTTGTFKDDRLYRMEMTWETSFASESEATEYYQSLKTSLEKQGEKSSGTSNVSQNGKTVTLHTRSKLSDLEKNNTVTDGIVSSKTRKEEFKKYLKIQGQTCK